MRLLSCFCTAALATAVGCSSSKDGGGNTPPPQATTPPAPVAADATLPWTPPPTPAADAAVAVARVAPPPRAQPPTTKPPTTKPPTTKPPTTKPPTTKPATKPKQPVKPPAAPARPVDLQVLPTSWTKRQVDDYMKATVSKALGVKCDYCHDKTDFAKDSDHKLAARAMMTMTNDMNKRFFTGKPRVSCMTCHMGKTEPAGN